MPSLLGWESGTETFWEWLLRPIGPAPAEVAGRARRKMTRMWPQGGRRESIAASADLREPLSLDALSGPQTVAELPGYTGSHGFVAGLGPVSTVEGEATGMGEGADRELFPALWDQVCKNPIQSIPDPIYCDRARL